MGQVIGRDPLAIDHEVETTGEFFVAEFNRMFFLLAYLKMKLHSH